MPDLTKQLGMTYRKGGPTNNNGVRRGGVSLYSPGEDTEYTPCEATIFHISKSIVEELTNTVDPEKFKYALATFEEGEEGEGLVGFHKGVDNAVKINGGFKISYSGIKPSDPFGNEVPIDYKIIEDEELGGLSLIIKLPEELYPVTKTAKKMFLDLPGLPPPFEEQRPKNPPKHRPTK